MSEQTTREKVTQRLIEWATRELELCAKAGRDAHETMIVHRIIAKEVSILHALSGYVVDDDDHRYARINPRRIADAEEALAWHTEVGGALSEILALLMTRHREEGTP